jgi:hypothetical protein
MTSSTVLSYPIPLYQNVPIQANFFQPSQFFISAITLGRQTTVTATNDMNFVIGQQVRLIIPPKSGCIQLNGAQGYVIDIPNVDQVTLNIDSSRNVDAFITTSERTQPQILGIGDINSGIISISGANLPSTNIPGAFINISPG